MSATNARSDSNSFLETVESLNCCEGLGDGDQLRRRSKVRTRIGRGVIAAYAMVDGGHSCFGWIICQDVPKNIIHGGISTLNDIPSTSFPSLASRCRR